LSNADSVVANSRKGDQSTEVAAGEPRSLCEATSAQRPQPLGVARRERALPVVAALVKQTERLLINQAVHELYTPPSAETSGPRLDEHRGLHVCHRTRHQENVGARRPREHRSRSRRAWRATDRGRAGGGADDSTRAVWQRSPSTWAWSTKHEEIRGTPSRPRLVDTTLGPADQRRETS